MNDSGSNYEIYSRFAEFGFVAGITLKGIWDDKDSMYDFIRHDVLKDQKRLVIPNQVHGADIGWLSHDNSNLELEVDGVITSHKDICLTVTTADCLPLIMADPTTGLFAAVHVGWRGYLGGILDNFVLAASNLKMNIMESQVFLGPGIGECCFEVGVEVAVLFDGNYVRQSDKSCHINLRQAVWNKIASMGVHENNMGNVDDCTSCNANRYYSYRRDKISPIQMVTFISRKE